MQYTDKDRGANVRRNLRHWRKPLILMTTGWFVLTLAVSAGAIIYAHEHHFSQRRVKMLGESCGMILTALLVIAWLIVFVMADRKKINK